MPFKYEPWMPILSFEDWAESQGIIVDELQLKEKLPLKRKYKKEVVIPFSKTQEAKDHTEKKAQRKSTARAKKERDVAAALGLKALKGTAKQKAWGEKLRKYFLQNVICESELDALKASKLAQNASFWIDTRHNCYGGIVRLLKYYD